MSICAEKKGMVPSRIILVRGENCVILYQCIKEEIYIHLKPQIPLL